MILRPTRTLLVVIATLGAAVIAAPAAAAAPVSWSTPTNPDPMRGWVTDLDCVTPQWCMAVDLGGMAVRFSGGHWHRPVRVETPTPENGFYSLACPSTSLCFASDGEGRVARFNGRHWSTPALLGAGFRAGRISCASTTFCMSVNRTIGIWNGTSWSAHPNPIHGDLFTAFSCASRRFCMAVRYTNKTGNVAWIYRNHTWQISARLYHEHGNMQWDISCTSSHFCMSIGDFEVAERWDGTRWTRSVRAEFTGNDMRELSCTSRRFCLSTGDSINGQIHSVSTVWDGRHWKDPQSFDRRHEAVAVSCAEGTTNCVAMDRVGRAMRRARETWSRPIVRDPSAGGITGVSCGADRCAAVDATGRALIYDGQSWGPAVKIDHFADLDSGGLLLSCAPDNFCMTLDFGGHARRLDGRRWSVTDQAPLHPVALSCRSAHWCLTMNGRGQVSVWRGAHWSAPRSRVHSSSGDQSRWALSCASRTFCVAFDEYAATVHRWVDGQWVGGYHLTDTYQYQAGVSCTSATFCMTTGGDFRTWRYTGTSWHRVDSPAQQVVSVSCRTAQLCVGVGTGGDLLSYAGHSWQLDATIYLPYYGYFDSIDCTATFCVTATPVDVSIGTFT